MKKPLAIFFAIILLMGNSGLTLATHLCGGHAVMNKVTLGSEHLDCGMADMDETCESKDGLIYTADNCCENQYQSIELTDDLIPSKTGQFDHILYFAIAWIHTLGNIDLFPVADNPRFALYSPPLLFRDLPVLHQVFII